MTHKDKTRYYSLLPEVDIQRTLDERLAKDDVDAATKAAWGHLKKNNRITIPPHVTIVHKKGLSDPVEQEVWDRCARLQGTGIMFSGRLGHVIWDGRVMAVTFEEFALAQHATNQSDANSSQDVGQKGVEFVSNLPAETRRRLHITVGTMSPDIPPVEAKGLVEAWKNGQVIGRAKIYELGGPVVNGRIIGLIW